MSLKDKDPQIYKLIKEEEKRQKFELEMIPSENYASAEVIEALGSVLVNKYSEGYPGKRYYQGNKFIDEIETLAIERAKKLFNVPHANVQPYSGSPANAAVYFALLERGDTILGLELASGGHLTHGHPKVTFSGKYFTTVQYTLNKEGLLDYKQIEELALKYKPKIIVSGSTAYPRAIDFEKFGKIAKKVGAYHVADISHIAGLVAGGVHMSPVEYADIVTTTTHKTLRGPRGAVIMVTNQGLKKDPELASKIDKAVFPGLQGGPHNNTTAATAVALKFAGTADFRKYARQIVKNSQTLAAAFSKLDFKLISGGTDNHLILIDITNKGMDGWCAAKALEVAGIIVNRNTIPGEKRSAFYPSGIRLGTAALTAREMKEPEMKKVAQLMNEAVEITKKYITPQLDSPTKEVSRKARSDFRKSIEKDKGLLKIAEQVKILCKSFPVPYTS